MKTEQMEADAGDREAQADSAESDAHKSQGAVNDSENGTDPQNGADSEVGSTETESLSKEPYRKRPLRVRVTAWGVILAVLAGSGYLLFRTLDDASLFFLSVDRAVAQRDDLGSRRFQLHGTPVPATIDQANSQGQTVVWFALAGEDEENAAWILHTGDPPDLFQPCVPVVLQGNWEDVQSQTINQIRPEDRGLLRSTTFADGYYFSSDRILVKHDNDYTLPDDESSLGAADPDDSSHGDDVLSRLSGCPNK